MYTGKIYKNGVELSIQEAVSQNLINVDVNGDIWLSEDTYHFIKITGDLLLN